MKILIFIIIINVISLALGSTYRINLNKNIKLKRASMKMAWKMKSSVEIINLYVREIAFIIVWIIGVLTLRVIFSDVSFLKIWMEGELVGNIGLLISTILALGTVIFMFWGGVSQGMFKVDVYSQFKDMNHLKRRRGSKVFTSFIRPLIKVLTEGYLYFYLLIEILKREGIQNIWMIYLIGVVIFTLYKIMIYSRSNQMVLIGSWYFCIGVFGYLLLGVYANMITLFFYLMVGDSIWIYKQ